MELTKNDTRVLKGIGILFMVILHLFARKDVNGLYETLILIDGVPLAYYIGHFGDACRPIYLFASGYAFYIVINKENNSMKRMKRNLKRILKLLINYWIILIMFVSIGFLVGNELMFPGSLTNFILNFFVLSNTYNGAWWFLQVYIIIVVFAPILIRLVKRYKPIPLIFVFGCIYSISYLQFYKDIFLIGDSSFISIIVRTIVLTGTSLFSFIIGSIFAKEKIFTQIYNRFYKIKYRNTFCYLGIFTLLIIHSIFESASIAPLTGISFICFFVFIDKSQFVKKILNFMAQHSTNIWLTHMFFYMTIFPVITFAPRYPLFILLWLLTLCIITSYVIKFINNPIVNLIDKKNKGVRYEKKAVI